MKNLKTIVKHIALLLALCLVFGMAGCGEKEIVVSDPEADNNILYGNAVDTEDGDDADVTEDGTANNNGTGNNASGGSTSGSGNTGNGLVSQGGSAGGNSGNGLVSQGGSAGGNSGGSKPSGTVGTPSQNYRPDVEETKSFLESVPKNLKGTTVRVLIWWTPGVTESAKAAAFEKATGIKIKFVQTGLGGEYTTKLSSLIQQKNSPDLACIGQENFPALIMQNNFQTLDVAKLNLKDPIYDIDTMNTFKYDGKYYGAMVKSSTMITFYSTFFNRDMFKKYGVKNPYELWQEGNWNWETFVSTAQDIKKKAGLSNAVACDYGAYYIVQSAGTDPVKFNNGKIINNCKDPMLETAWKFKNELKTKYNIMDGSGSHSSFMGGNTAMLLTGNYIAQRGDVLDKQAKFDWAMAPIPCPKGQKTIVPGAVKLWGIPRGAKNAEAAGYWLRYWLDANFDPVDKPLWSNEEATTFNNWLWEQPKQFTNFTGIVSYGGNYSWETMSNDLSNAGDNIRSVLDSWSGTIDKNIEKIEKEFGR